MNNTPNTDAIATAKKLLTEVITAGGLPIAVSHPEKDGTLTIVVAEDGTIKNVDDYGAEYAGKTLNDLPVSELGLLVDHGSRDKDVIEDLSYTESPQI